MTTDLHDNLVRVGDTVRAWAGGEPFTATVAEIAVGRGHAEGTDLLTLACPDGSVVERDSNAVEVTR